MLNRAISAKMLAFGVIVARARFVLPKCPLFTAFPAETMYTINGIEKSEEAKRSHRPQPVK